jgi:hypothetical protein
MDKDIGSWLSTGGTATRSNSDAEHCPYSGELTIVVPHGTGAFTLSSCASNIPLSGDFNFGIQYEFDSTGLAPATPICQVTFNSGFNCDADLVSQNEINPPAQTTSGWQRLSGTLSGVPPANSVQFVCYLSGSPNDDLMLHFDMAYVSRAPNQY